MEMIPVKRTLKSVFTSSTFELVSVGLMEEVTVLPGNPGSEYDFDADHYLTKILFYENYEFKFQSFYDDSGEYKLTRIHNHHIKYLGTFEGEFDPGKVTLDPWFFKSSPTFEEVKISFKGQRLECILEQKYKVLFIKFSNGSEIFFEQEDQIRSHTHFSHWICCGGSHSIRGTFNIC
jgi:hypothetical protein